MSKKKKQFLCPFPQKSCLLIVLVLVILVLLGISLIPLALSPSRPRPEVPGLYLCDLYLLCSLITLAIFRIWPMGEKMSLIYSDSFANSVLPPSTFFDEILFAKYAGGERILLMCNRQKRQI